MNSDEKSVIWTYQPGSQETLLAHPWVFEILLHGTKGGGKSEVCLVDFISECGKGYGNGWNGLAIRNEYKQLNDLRVKFEAILRNSELHAEFNKNDYGFTFETGETFLLRAFKDFRDYDKQHGQESQFMFFDEITNWADLELYHALVSTIRGGDPRVHNRVRSACNPYGIGHQAVKDYFKPTKGDDGKTIKKRKRTYTNPLTNKVIETEIYSMNIFSSLWENKWLLENDPRYIQTLEKSCEGNEAMRAAYFDGSWDYVAGGMFEIWNPKYHCVQEFTIPKSWYVDRSYDHGSAAPFAVLWWAESDGTPFITKTGKEVKTVQGDLFLIREYYGCVEGKANKGIYKLPPDIAQEILEREEIIQETQLKDNREIYGGPADSQIWEDEHRKSVASEMEEEGVYWDKVKKPGGSRRVGWDIMRKMLINAKHEKRTGPGLFIFEKYCPHFIRTIPTLPRDEKDPDDIPKRGTEDHIADACRYRVYHAGEVPLTEVEDLA